MKRLIQVLIISWISLTLGYSQSDIIFSINHKLGDTEFELDKESKNNLGHDFKASRLEYYISQISIIHDEEVQTNIEDVWILVNASEPTEVNLGQYDIENVEKIILHVGVNPEHNHLDPASYPESHPLAPKAPSMHWGWTAGYRFVAFEGKSGSKLDQLFQLHGLGDDNYFTTEIPFIATSENGEIRIDIDANYDRALEDIQLTSGVIVHGDKFEAKQCLENFRDYVFTQAGTSSNITANENLYSFSIYPNPVNKLNSKIFFKNISFSDNFELVVMDIDGSIVSKINNVQNGQTLNFSDLIDGIYILNLLSSEKLIASSKIVLE